MGVHAVAGRSGAVGDGYTQEKPIGVAKTLQDAVVGKHFDVILMGGNAHVRGARQGRRDIEPVGNEKFGCGISERDRVDDFLLHIPVLYCLMS